VNGTPISLIHPTISLSGCSNQYARGRVLGVNFTRRMNASPSSSFFLPRFCCWEFGTILILGLYDMARYGVLCCVFCLREFCCVQDDIVVKLARLST
jgi:hypothetical protein